MQKQLYIIVNQQSGSGRGKLIFNEVAHQLRQLNLSFITLTTQYKGHTIELTMDILNKAAITPCDVMVIGGDGTLNEVVTTCIQQNVLLPITYFPAGTGNDFHRTWQKGATIKQIIEGYLYTRTPQTIPIFYYQDFVAHQKGIVLNSFGFGLDGNVIYRVNELPRTSFLRKFAYGKFSYLFGLIRSLKQLPKFDVTLTANGSTTTFKNVHLLSMMNSPYMGGGIRLSQKVIAHHHSIGIVIIKDVNFWQMIHLFWSIIVKKQTPDSEHFLELTTRNATIQVSPATWSQIDGELQAKREVSLQIEVSDYPFYLPNA